ncbi:putative disease resistance protein RGA3 [Telopea speciosissima]|uniref:putative disease resistance protein RGA3 n=1 Tax=Telopea speciosissima TaxID=54955 RepID=UPI001CC70467|nr:putative disease resistance protein RGA3 [Telopea speciosissima]
MEDVLESLQPHPNLEKLIIRGYPGVLFPNWMLSSSHATFMNFSNLVYLELRGCRKCKQLPPTLGKLPSLETLVIGGMAKVKFMGVEFFGINDDGATRSSDGGVVVDTTIIFPKLKVFHLSNMSNLEEWDMRIHKQDRKEFIFMPCLQYLFLLLLPKLRLFPQHLTQATTLMKLFIWDCPKLTWMQLPSPSSSSSHNLPPFLQVEELILKEDAGSFSKALVRNNHVFLPKLKLLRVRLSPYSSLPKGLGKLTSLESLDIRTCSKIKSIPEEVGELQHLTALQELRIMRCPALRRRCQKEIGEDWNKISHIPNIFIDDKKIK